MHALQTALVVAAGIATLLFPTYSQQDSGPQTPSPTLLSGRVVLEDGTPPPLGSVTIQAVCSGLTLGRPDSKGRFTLSVGENMFNMADARGSRSGRRGGACGLRAVGVGYHPVSINLFRRPASVDVDLGTIVMHPVGKTEGRTLSETSLQAPESAQKAFAKGLEAISRQQGKDAEKDFNKAVELYPQYAEAWYQLGRLAESRDDMAAARRAYGQALGADEKYPAPRVGLAVLAVREKKWQEAADLSDVVIRGNPGEFPEAYLCNAQANYSLGNLGPAEQSAREAVRLDTQHRLPRANQVLGLLLAKKGDYSGAAGQLRVYLQFYPDAPDASKMREHIAEWSKTAAH